MALYGKALARQLPSSTTGNQARLAFGAMTAALNKAYAKLDEYDAGLLGTAASVAPGIFGTILSAIHGAGVVADANSVSTARGYLDDINGILNKYFPDMPVSDAVLTEQQFAELSASVSTCSVAVKTVDDLFSTSFLEELCDAILAAVPTVAGAIANAASKALGSTLGSLWWVIALGLGGFFAWRKWGKKVLPP